MLGYEYQLNMRQRAKSDNAQTLFQYVTQGSFNKIFDLYPEYTKDILKKHKEELEEALE